MLFTGLEVRIEKYFSTERNISLYGPTIPVNNFFFFLRRFDKQAAKHHGFECIIPGVASMTL
jgi:hypothetical protein